MALAKKKVKITEEGYAFKRTIFIEGKKKKTKTEKIKRNPEKVVLGYIGNLQLYVYPFGFPDTVFLGNGSKSTQITSTNVQQLLGAYNQSRWFLSKQAFSKPKKAKGANSRRQAIERAYNIGRKTKLRPNKGESSLNNNKSDIGNKPINNDIENDKESFEEFTIRKNKERGINKNEI